MHYAPLLQPHRSTTYNSQDIRERERKTNKNNNTVSWLGDRNEDIISCNKNYVKNMVKEKKIVGIVVNMRYL